MSSSETMPCEIVIRSRLWGQTSVIKKYIIFFRGANRIEALQNGKAASIREKGSSSNVARDTLSPAVRGGRTKRPPPTPFPPFPPNPSVNTHRLQDNQMKTTIANQECGSVSADLALPVHGVWPGWYASHGCLCCLKRPPPVTARM